MLDQLVGLGLLDGVGRAPPRRRRRTRTPARMTRSRATQPAGGRRAPPPRGARGPSGVGDLGGRLGAPGEELVQLVVVEPRVRADPAPIEARRPRLALAAEHDLGRNGEALDPGRQAARVVAERRRKHRLDRARDVGAGAAAKRLGVERASRPDVGGHVGDVDPEPDAVPLGLGRDRVVEVARGRRVDGEGRRARSGRGAQPAARGRRLRHRAPRPRARAVKPRCVPRSQSRAATTSRARSAEPSGRSTLAPRAPKSTSAISPGPTLGPPARVACGPRSNSGSATVKRPRRSTLATRRPRPAPRRGLTGSRRQMFSASTASAFCSASSCGALRLFSDLDVRGDPLAGKRGAVRREVLADRQVERAARREVDDLLEGALAEGARADDRRHVMLSRAPRRGSRRRRRCRGRSGPRSACVGSGSPTAS